jgi:hypothetical protein
VKSGWFPFDPSVISVTSLRLGLVAALEFGRNPSISDPQKFLPLPNVAFESQTHGNLESLRYGSFDLLPRLSKLVIKVRD